MLQMNLFPDEREEDAPETGDDAASEEKTDDAPESGGEQE